MGIALDTYVTAPVVGVMVCPYGTPAKVGIIRAVLANNQVTVEWADGSSESGLASHYCDIDKIIARHAYVFSQQVERRERASQKLGSLYPSPFTGFRAPKP